MPTRPQKARRLLQDGKAEVVQRDPFTIRLTVPSGKHTQPVTVGVDMGAKTVGVAAVGNGSVLYQGEVQLRDDIHWRMDRRRRYRRHRRGRKCRYRQPRFNNRASSRRKGRLPPSIKSKSDTTVKVVRRVASFLPISTIRVEVANFDTHAMKRGVSRLPSWAYQRGELYGEENIKAYVRARDDYTCQYCGMVRPPDLEVDHIVPSSRGGTTTPNNLCCACHECNQRKGKHTAAEFGYSEVQGRVRRRHLKAATHTQAGKTTTLEALADIALVETTHGYVTKVDRLALDLPKTHYLDAVVIASGGHRVELMGWYEAMRAVAKGNYRQRRGARSHLVASLPREVFGFRQWDKVQLPDGSVGFVKGRRSSGQFAIADLDGNLVKGSITHRKLKLVGRASTLLTGRREAHSSPC